MLKKTVLTLKFFFCVSLVGAVFTLFPINSVQAQGRSYEYDSVNIDIDVNADSTMVVKEELTYRFNGTYHAVFRDITLVDEDNLRRCQSDATLQCGGFEFIEIQEVLDNQGNPLIPAAQEDLKYNDDGNVVAGPDKFVVTNEYVDLDKRFRVQWIFSEEGKNFDNELLKFTIKYKVYGAIGYYDDYDLFYWNAIFSDREANINKANINITFPEPVDSSPVNFQIPGQGNQYVLNTLNGGRTLNLMTENLLPYEEFTILQKVSKNVIQEYATVNLDLSPSDQNVLINNTVYLSDVGEQLKGLPPGEVNLTFSQKGRHSQDVKLDLKPGEVRDLKVILSMTKAQTIKVILMVALNVLGMMFLPLGILILYRLWKRKGRDTIKNKVVVPEYSPPQDIHPYLLGSLKDERVDIVDITATIIDLACRGYIKIKEFGAKQVLGIKVTKTDYELIKQKEFADLSEVEKEIMDSVFGTRDRVTTNDLKNKFYLKVPKIKKSIYKDLVDKKYFSENPDSVRIKYVGYGILVVILAVVLIISSFVVPIFIGTAIATGILGIVLLFLSKYMPSKTETGSLTFHKILGFKMYMETAEKYRVQNLTPETFEKFLSYAIVFGIEEKWAETFKDIYKGSPDWYEGNTDTFSTIYLANSLGRFNTTAASAMTVSPNSSGSSRGGGWSGGGGFSGGFSGGGGGGGGGGAW